MDLYSLTENDLIDNPSLIINAINLSDELISSALEYGYVPKVNDFYLRPELIQYKQLLLKAFEIDKSAIVFFSSDMINLDIMGQLRKSGYVVNEDNLKQNPILCQKSLIMIPAIMKNPKLIIYTAKECSLPENLIKRAIREYKITNSDFENHPELFINDGIMNQLSQYKSLNKKLLIKKQIKRGIISSDYSHLSKLFILDEKFESNELLKSATKLIKSLYEPIDENNINVQAYYFSLLDKIIDSIINIRYENSKHLFLYADIVQLHANILSIFSKIDSGDRQSSLYQLINKLSEFSDYNDTDLFYKYIEDNIINLYKQYNEKRSLDLNDTRFFCNQLLNWQRNGFISHEKRKIKDELKEKLKLAKKKRDSIIISEKIKKVAWLLENKEYDKLNTSIDEIKDLLKGIRYNLQHNKFLKRHKISITDSMFDNMENYFMKYGMIINNYLSKILGIEKKVYLKYIRNKYNKIILKFIDNISLNNEEEIIKRYNRTKEGFDYHNFTIVDNDRYTDNLLSLLLEINETTLKSILDSQSYLFELKKIIPLVGIIKELDIGTLINILSNYQQIRKTITLNNQDNQRIENLISLHFDDVLKLANGYSLVNDMVRATLTDKVVDVLGGAYNRGYLDIYLQMISRKGGYIPPLSLEYKNAIFESGVYSDPERLLIGKRYSNSCIDISSVAGVETYYECLIRNTGDVIIVRDRHSGEFLSRILLIRRGNVVQIIDKAGNIFDIEIYVALAKQIIDQAKTIGDNIDFVFKNGYILGSDNNLYPRVENSDFTLKFPHADTSISATLVGSKYAVGTLSNIIDKLDFDAKPVGIYDKKRCRVSYNSTVVELTRLRALNTYLQNGGISNKEIENYFKPLCVYDYDWAMSGEDWYIALKNGEMIEQLILPIADDEAMEEINSAMDTLKARQLIYKL